MPWECPACRSVVATDDVECPSCAAPKTSWTLAADVTRTLVFGGGKRFELLRAGPDGALAPAEVAPVTSVDEATRWTTPPAQRLLVVRLFPKRHKDLTVGLAVEFETLEVDERELPFEGEPTLADDGSVDVSVLLVRGEGEVTFTGVHVVAVGEASERGFAPTIEVAALGKPPRRVPTEPAGEADDLELVFGDPEPAADVLASEDADDVDFELVLGEGAA